MSASVAGAPKGFTTRWTTVAGDHVMAVEWLPGGDGCVVGDAAGGLLLIDRATGAARARVGAHRAGLTSLACDPLGHFVATCGQDGHARLWDATTGAWHADLPAGAEWAERVAWSRDGGLLACAAGRAVRIWNREGVLVRAFAGHRATVTDVQWHPRDRRLCSTSYGGVTMIDPDLEAPVAQFSWQGSSLLARWSPSGRYVATAEQDSTVHFWIVESGRDLQMSGYPSKVRALAWGAKGRLLATGGGLEVTVWDCSGRGPAGTKPTTLSGHERQVSALAFQHHGGLLASGGDDGRVVLWQPDRSRKPSRVAALDEPVASLAWSPDDRDLLVGGARGDVRVLNPQA